MISAAKFEELKKAFPKCRIESNGGTASPAFGLQKSPVSNATMDLPARRPP